MKPTVLRFPPNVDLREPDRDESADVILFPRIRGLLTDLVSEWNARGYTVGNNKRGRLVVRKASRATVFFNRFRRNSK